MRRLEWTSNAQSPETAALPSDQSICIELFEITVSLELSSSDLHRGSKHNRTVVLSS